MVATIPPLLIEKPTPSMPLRYGILQAALGPFDLPVHARNGGLRYVTSLCDDGFGYEINCIGSTASKTAEFSLGTTTVTGTPFIIAATVTCGSVGYTYDEQRAFVMDRLRGVEQAVLENIFSTSTVGQGPGLIAADGIITVAGAGDSVGNVLSELERARYCGFAGNLTRYGPPGVLHVAIPVLNALRENHLAEKDSAGRWVTPMGTVISAGCYANNDPAGAAPADGVFWMYLTGQTTIWRTPDSDVQVAPVEGSLNRTTNQFLMLAEREYVVTYECGGFAKPVTLWT